MDKQQLKAELLTLLKDKTLFDESNLNARIEAIDFIEFAGQALRVPGQDLELGGLYREAASLRVQLVETNEALFRRVRADLQAGYYTRESLRAFLLEFTDFDSENRDQPRFEFDGLDALLASVLLLPDAPSESQARESGMIRYEPTPANIILELVDSIRFTPDDIFFDVGSGYGLVVMLVNLLTGVPSVGIEYDPAYCDFARSCAEALNLKDVTFIQTDARSANLNAGTIFYLFTPFVNEIYDNVLERLRYTAIRHQIYICSYGTITYELTKLPWLQIRDPAMEHDFELAIFSSKL
jgi:hypothetical protein